SGGQRAFTADYPEERWHQVIAVNLTGVWLCMKYEIAQMLHQGGGTIVNTASAAGLVGLPYASAYVASKHGGKYSVNPSQGMTRPRLLVTLIRCLCLPARCPRSLSLRSIGFAP